MTAAALPSDTARTVRLFQGPSPFGELLVTWSRRTQTVSLFHGGYLQSRADAQGVSRVDYIQAMHGLATQQPPGDVLMLGCGGGTLGTMLSRDGWRVTIVDINPTAFDLARRFFSLAANIACIADDGFEFLNRTRAKFDVIICDMYLGDEAAPYAGAPQFLARASKRLKLGGRIFLNVIVYGDNDPTADRVARAAQSSGLTVRILDGHGHVGRNAVLCVGAVEKLRKPRITQPPSTGVAAIAAAVDRFSFRKPSIRRAMIAAG